MGIERVLQDQKEKSKQKKQVENNNDSTSCINAVVSNKAFAKKTENISQDKRVIKDGENSTIAARDQKHQKKIDHVKSMLNLK